jgi:hypothetical protein
LTSNHCTPVLQSFGEEIVGTLLIDRAVHRVETRRFGRISRDGRSHLGRLQEPFARHCGACCLDRTAGPVSRGGVYPGVLRSNVDVGRCAEVGIGHSVPSLSHILHHGVHRGNDEHKLGAVEVRIPGSTMAIVGEWRCGGSACDGVKRATRKACERAPTRQSTSAALVARPLAISQPRNARR